MHHPNGGAISGAGGVGGQNAPVDPRSIALVGRPRPWVGLVRRCGQARRPGCRHYKHINRTQEQRSPHIHTTVISTIGYAAPLSNQVRHYLISFTFSNPAAHTSRCQKNFTQIAFAIKQPKQSSLHANHNAITLSLPIPTSPPFHRRHSHPNPFTRRLHRPPRMHPHCCPLHHQARIRRPLLHLGSPPPRHLHAHRPLYLQLDNDPRE